ncbi:MAG: ABC transporter ATP-binding protein [Actinomycetota bacterium]|nr:ABC transporter ATP-binding protein [Actinomycetota bacterium]
MVAQSQRPLAPHPRVPVQRPIMILSGVSKIYGAGDIAVHALRDVDFMLERGDYLAIIGSSGSGKSTLMNIVGCLDQPTHGSYLLDGIDVGALDDFELSYIRNRQIGLVFQSFNLIPRTTVLRNVELPLIYARVHKAERRRRALAAIDAVGLADRSDHIPAKLSGGQQQRAAVARAIVTEPAIILADEPTGNLDTASTFDILEIFHRLNSEGRTIVMITHEPDVAAHAKRVIQVADGKIVADMRHAPVAGPPPRPQSASPDHLQVTRTGRPA